MTVSRGDARYFCRRRDGGRAPQTPAAPQPQTQKPPVNPDAKALADFNERVKKYLELHNRLEATLPSLPDQSDPKRIGDHQASFAKLIADARAGARPGDIFTPPVRRIFRRVIRNVLARARAAAKYEPISSTRTPRRCLCA